MTVEPSLLSAIEWRNIGPHRGGRCVAVAGDPTEPATFYFGACSGGVWKTTDAGAYWENVSDGFFNTAAIGALEVALSDPNVIYAGTGEACIRGNVSHGDGVYRSTDAGKTWTHCGLSDTRHIARVRVHPTDPNVAYVAALGHAFGPNNARGIFRTKDGGKTWEHVLFRNEDTGAADFSIDQTNPRVLYAALWDVRRYPWELRSGGPGSGIFRSIDGGDTWTELTDKPGLPRGLKGRIGVAASPVRSGRVWALVEAEDGGLFRSDDGGDTWERICEDRELRQRPWYYMHVFADSVDADTCYVLNLRMWKSTDGGKTFTQITTPHGDNHDLWIDPQNPRRMIEGNDGGACVSFNGGDSWSTIYNQPTAQFYHLAVDNRWPYWVMGTQQDNSAISAPSYSNAGAIPYRECQYVGHSESGYIAVRPDNPNVIYSGAIGSSPGGGGSLLRYDHSTRQTQIITVWPEAAGGWGAKDQRHRFQWTYPIVISPHDPNTLYVTGERVFRTRDEGMSWEPISPDLTRNDVSKLGPSGGPITKDTTGAEHYCTIFSFVESPHEKGVFYAGSDDGLVHISKDGGANWENITPPGLPEWATVNMLEVSPHDKATVYLSANRYRLDDTRPYLFKSNDYGTSWTQISNGIPEHEFTRCVREDTVRRGLLFAGTETCIYVSFDDGGSWQPVRQNLPVVPVYDLKVKDSDLVAATHGRSFWILDDLTVLRQMSADIAGTSAHLFQPRPTLRSKALADAGEASPGKNYTLGLGTVATFKETKNANGRAVRTFLDAGSNPPYGVMVTYYLKDKPQGEVTLSFLDAAGNEIKSYKSKPEESGPPELTGIQGTAKPATNEVPEEPTVPNEAGANRFVWNMRYSDAHRVPGDGTAEGGIPGPVAPPGTYQVRLTVDGQSLTQPFEIVVDSRVSATQADLDAQFKLLIQIRDKLSETHDAINQMRDLKDQIDGWVKRAESAGGVEGISELGASLKRRLAEIEQELIESRSKGRLDSINFPTRLNAKLAALPAVIVSADTRPPKQTYEVFEHLSRRVDEELQRLRQALDSDLPELNNRIRQANLQPIIPAPPPSKGAVVA